MNHAASIGFEVVRERKGSENGYCDFVGKKIGVHPDVASAQALKTLVQVRARSRAVLHSEGPGVSREVAETEVESVAFVVCDVIGLDTGDYSFPYVARWAGGSEDLIRDTAGRVVNCARMILERLTVERYPERPAV